MVMDYNGTFARIAMWSMLLLIPTAALADDCKSIADATARMACFDKASKAVKKPVGDPATDAAKHAIISSKSRMFTDADSLKDVAIGPPFPCASGVGSCVCVEANGKTPAGGYAGLHVFVVKIKGPTEAEMIGEMFKPETCGKMVSFPQMNGKR
ncbi:MULTISPECIES: hypothetical protein [unclassified Bradyrhizobium]|uniref:hypothetical protein n=2 Tax=Bradyrhizobium TaxID=374 RepID=UPI001FFA8021|nr:MULTISPECIES: hypothetical protein [unclassified Bradyrhizobium]MCK1611058.1 hypothetical protein [Bradyrhizobium sp. 163]MCK1762812.1 hypothetical protein [Bradyrhizobium sp. 136]